MLTEAQKEWLDERLEKPWVLVIFGVVGAALFYALLWGAYIFIK